VNFSGQEDKEIIALVKERERTPESEYLSADEVLKGIDLNKLGRNCRWRSLLVWQRGLKRFF
jgi:hypothetical protein